MPLKNFLKIVADLIFPENCLSCRKSGSFLCPSCLEKIPPPEPVGDKIFVLFSYKDTRLRKAIWFLKYRNRRGLTEIFATFLSDYILEQISENNLIENFESPVIVPIPTHKQKLKQRGFNQSELIAKRVSQKINLSFMDALAKIKATPTQVSLKDKNSRLQNIVGSFAVKNPILVKDKNIILIDDVITTGATVKEARKILKNAGAKKILTFAIAH